MKTNIYIDGFNLYYGCLKNTQYKWLDVGKLCTLLLPKHQIQEIKYFTAIVAPRGDNPEQQIRQNVYLRALKTIPNLTIIKGHFLSNKIRLPLANNAAPTLVHSFIRGFSLHFWGPGIAWSKKRKTIMARVVKTSEKGSDVNLATHLLHDAYRDKFEAAVLITGDSDLLEPVRIVSKEIKKVVGIMCPQQHPSAVLLREANFYKEIRAKALSLSQFPVNLTDAHGTFHKPECWQAISRSAIRS
ncbi:MAG: NYN domain-containing protein [Verrucomicrobiia bacterium]